MSLESKVDRAAEKAFRQVSNPSHFRDQGHNEYFNKFCANLHDEGVSFEREKDVNGRKPDIYISGLGAIEVKARVDKLTTDEKEQAAFYAQYTEQPCRVINFGKKNGPHTNIFDAKPK